MRRSAAAPRRWEGALRRGAAALSLALLGSGLLMAAETGGLGVDGGPFRPYSIARARVFRPGGLRGRLRVEGLGWEGRRRLLFEAELADYAESVETAFYLDEEEKALLVELDGPEGSSSLELPLLGREADPAAELALRARIRSLPLPFRDPPRRASADHLLLAEDSLESAGRKAASELFALPGPGGLLPLLGGFALLSSLLALLPEKRRREKILALILLSCGTALALPPLLPRQALLYAASFPSADPAVSFSGLLEARAENLGEAARISFGEGGKIDFLGIHAPASLPLPLELLETEGARFHFDRSPVIRGSEGGLALETEGFLLGWRLHEEP